MICVFIHAGIMRDEVFPYFAVYRLTCVCVSKHDPSMAVSAYVYNVV